MTRDYVRELLQVQVGPDGGFHNSARLIMAEAVRKYGQPVPSK
jgi:hypothetical protein